MGRILFKQPNGAYGIYSTGSDFIVLHNITKENYTALSYKDFGDQHRQTLLSGIGFYKLEDYILPETWSKDSLASQVAISREIGYDDSFINKIKHRWRKAQDEDNE